MRPRGLALAQISKRTSNPAAAPPDRPETSEQAAGALPGEARILAAATAALTGDRRGVRKLWLFLVPAFVAAMAYADPDNFATNLAACAGSGYLLLWVIAEIVAMVTDLAAFIRAAIAG